MAERIDNKNTDRLVAVDDLEASLAAVERTIADPNAGIFGPRSIVWRIHRESALFLAAGRAALLQLAHPWVAVAIEQHSAVMNDPIARFHNTFRIVFTMIFGSKAQAFRAARSLHTLHTRIGGELPQAVAGYAGGSRYEANHLPALRWVYATLIDSAVMAYEWTLPSLTANEKATYYAEIKKLAALFGIPANALPENWRSFEAYMSQMCSSDALGVDQRSRAMAHRLLSGAGSWVRLPQWSRALTAAWLPDRLRAEFGLPFGAQEVLAVRSTQRWLPRLYRSLPSSLRFTGPYREACARLAGRGPSMLTRASNRFWMGETQMPFGERPFDK
jgi:uncharacterized protein (DUF2236 family)